MLFRRFAFFTCESIKEIVVKSFSRNMAETKRQVPPFPIDLGLSDYPPTYDATCIPDGVFLSGEDAEALFTFVEMFQQFIETPFHESGKV